MSSLNVAPFRGQGIFAWPLLAAIVFGMAACSSGHAPDQSRSAPTPQAAEPEPGTPPQPSPPRTNAMEPSHVAPTRAAPPTSQRPLRLPARQFNHPAAALARQPSGTPVSPLAPVSGSAASPSRVATPAVAAGLASYFAKVFGPRQLELPGTQGLLQVWIGLKQNLPEADSGTNSATQSLGVTGQTARITPVAPDFTVVPATTVCVRLVPSGSWSNFTLTPKRVGDLTVGADVQLFDSADCSGIPVPESTAFVHVPVKVCTKCKVDSGLASMGKTVWDGFSKFWEWLVGAFFLTIMVLLNRWRLRKFNVSKDDKV